MDPSIKSLDIIPNFGIANVRRYTVRFHIDHFYLSHIDNFIDACQICEKK